ncbi:MAG: hypothetical protein ACJ73D_01685 [Pyrinomonadaceae bacterium]
MIRELITKLSRSLSEKMVPPRRPYAAPIKVWFDPDVKTELALETARANCIIGETVDISANGIGFSVPFIRIKEKYLVNQDRPLNVEVDLPGGKVHLRMLGKRYEKVGMHSSQERFFVGATITELTGTDQEIYEYFVKNGAPRPRTTAERMGIVVE